MINYVTPNEQLQIKMELAKPNRVIIGNLIDFYGSNIVLRLGRLNEIQMTIPYWVTRRGKKVRNSDIDKFKTMYQLKLTIDDKEEWFVLSKKTKSASDGKEVMNVSYTSLGYQLRGKKIRQWAGVRVTRPGEGGLIVEEFQKESLTPPEVFNDLLSTSSWSYDEINSDLKTKYRSFDFSGTSVLDAVFQTAEKFGGILIWDTVNKTIAMKDQENYGKNEGLEISYGNYLKSLSEEELSDEVVTRLYVYGQDELSIRRVNPLGTSYLEDYGYFLQGFQMVDDVREDGTPYKRVISSSQHGMSDSLAIALVSYQDKVKANQGAFRELVEAQDTINKNISTKEREIDDLNEKIKIQENLIDVKQSEQRDASVELAEQARLKALLAAATSELDALRAELLDNLGQIATIKNSLDIETNLTREQILELDNYIYEDTFEDSNYIEGGRYGDKEADEVLYEDAVKAFKELSKPRKVLSMDIINLYKLLEGKQEWKKLILGSKVNVFYETLGIKSQTTLIEISINMESNSISVTIADTIDNETDEEKLSNILYESVGTSKVVDMNKFKFDSINNLRTDVKDLMSNRWDAAKNAIISGVDNATVMDNRGITTTSASDPNKFIRINNSVIGLTDDGGNTFRTAITANGIIASELVGQIIIGEQLEMENISGKFSFNRNGVTIDGAALTITGGLPKDQLDPAFADDLFELNKNYANGIRMDSVNGLVVTRSDDKVKAYFNATDGFKFMTKTGTTWKDTFYYDVVNNRLVLNGEGNFTELKVSGKSVLTTDKLKIDGENINEIKTDQLVAGTAKITTGMIETLEVGSNKKANKNVVLDWVKED